MAHLGWEIAAYVDGQLSPEATERAEAHFARCERCQRSLVQQRALKARMSGTSAPTPPPTLLASLDAVPSSPGRHYPFLPGVVGAAMVLMGASMVVVAAAYALAPTTRDGDPVRPQFDRFVTMASSVAAPRKHLSSAAMDELDQSGWPSQEQLGSGFKRVDGHLHDGHEVVAQMYVGHGESVLLFEQVGAIDEASVESFERHLVGDRLRWVREGNPRIVTWDADGMIYTVVTQLSDSHLEELFEDLPAPPPEPSAFERIRAGLVRMSPGH